MINPGYDSHDCGVETKLLLNGSLVCAMPTSERKVVLWHVSAGCNMCCRYCYGTFDGGSYKGSTRFKEAVGLDRIIQAAEDLSEAGFSRAHICGGEPFLFRGIWPFLEKLRRVGIERYVLTNGTFLPRGFEKAVAQNLFTNLSFSIDSINPIVNDRLRGRTKEVLRTIRHVVELRERIAPNLEIGIYIVLTRANLDDVKVLIDQVVEWGVDFATIQICYLPPDHPEQKMIGLTVSDRKEVLDVLSTLRSQASREFRVPGKPFFALSESVMSSGSLVATNCFADRGRFLFIDSEGNVRPCATKGGEKSIIGNIHRSRIRDFIARADKGPGHCHNVCADCLGAWEMMHPSIGNSNQVHFN